MTPGPDKIVACPHCKALARYWTLASGNTFGALRWTDGKSYAPMLRTPPGFVRCRDCRGFYWLDEAAPVGEDGGLFGSGEQGAARPEWADLPYVEEPSEAEYFEALAAGLSNSAREIDVRIFAWWRGNDAFRGSPFSDDANVEAVEASDRRRNLEALIGLLAGPAPDMALLKAEALRELGRFDEALAVLGRVEGESYAEFLFALRGYCEAGDSGLHTL